MNPSSNIFLIGPMGAGKTTVGRRMAQRLGLVFIDLDEEIEKHTGATIPLIFDLEGEEGFRRREAEMLDRISSRHGVLLATGGGAVLREDNQRRLRERGFVIFLDIAVESQIARLERDRRRPLLQAPDRRERLQSMAAIRGPIYRSLADLVVRSDGRSVHVMADRVLRQLGSLWRSIPHPESACAS